MHSAARCRDAAFAPTRDQFEQLVGKGRPSGCGPRRGSDAGRGSACRRHVKTDPQTAGRQISVAVDTAALLVVDDRSQVRPRVSNSAAECASVPWFGCGFDRGEGPCPCRQLRRHIDDYLAQKGGRNRHIETGRSRPTILKGVVLGQPTCLVPLCWRRW